MSKVEKKTVEGSIDTTSILSMVQFDLLASSLATPGTSPALQAQWWELFEEVLSRG